MSVRIALNHQKQLGTSSPCPHLGIQRGEADLWSPFCPAVLHVLTHRRCILPLFLFAARQSALDGKQATPCLWKIIWQRGPTWEPWKMDLISFAIKRKPLLGPLERLLVW
ncbi:hypothetical protein T08_801 [Trichinella sp. T8]|nr:hypothetical protein T08_801 [Trichinella sp. T8]